MSLWLLLTPFLWMILAGNQVVFLPGAEYTDLLVSHYPNAVFLHRALFEWGQVPLWSNTILSGYPFAANPLAGLWYPPGWLPAVFPQPWVFHLTAGLHLAFGGWGMARLMRAEGLSARAAIASGLFFAWMPKLWAHYAAGHVTLLYAVCWTPWLLGAVRRRWQPALFFGAILLADPRWAAPAGLAWLARALIGQPLPRLPGAAARLAGQNLLAAALAGPLLLPLWQYSQLSTRAALTSADQQQFALPPAVLLTLTVPIDQGAPEWVVHPGAAALALGLVALVVPGVRRKAGFWLGLILAGWVVAAASSLPPLSWLFALPGLDLLRAPSRFLFLSGIGWAGAAGWGLEYFWEQRTSPNSKRSLLLALALTAALTLIGLYVLLALNQGKLLASLWSVAFLAAWAVLALRHFRDPTTTPVLRRFGLGLIVLEIVVAARLGWSIRPLVGGLNQVWAAANLLQQPAGAGRVYSPDYAIPQHTAAVLGLEMASGVDPLQLRSYVEVLRPATGIAGDGYSVVFPPMNEDGTFRITQPGYPDLALFRKWNIGWVVSRRPIHHPGLETVSDDTGVFVYRVANSAARAVVIAPDGHKDPVPISRYRANDITLEQVAGPGRLVLAEQAYPGWEVLVDGTPAELLVQDGHFRAVDLPPGEHMVVFRFRPRVVYAGCALSAGAAITLMAVWWQGRRRFPAEREAGHA